jgi:hypothetical protein
MDSVLDAAAAWIAESGIRSMVVDALREVPGLPPLIQAVHILGVAVMVAVVIVPNLRVLGMAATGQSYAEMIGRLAPWTWWTLGVLLTCGGVFVIARPYRYLGNPIVAIKLGCLVVALVITVWTRRRAVAVAPDFGGLHKTFAALSVLAWVGVILGGRWIAYVDYLFWET